MGTDDSPCDENTSSQSFLGAGVPALSDVIALQQYEFEQSLANQQLWSQQLALEQEAKIKAAAEQVQKQVSDLTKVLKGGDNPTPNVEALESFHARHVHDLRQHSKSLPDLSKSECELACPDKLKKEKKENEVSLPKFKAHHRSSPLSSERYRKESCCEKKDRDRRSRSRDKIRGRGRDTIRSRSRDKIRSRSRDTISSRSRDKIRGRIRDTIRNRSRDRRGRRRSRSRSWSRSRDRRRSRSRSRGRAVDRHRERSRSGSKSRGAALDGQHREKTSERSRKVQTHNEDDTLRSPTSHVSKSHIPSRISSKGHSSAYHLKDNNVTNTIASREETGTEEQKGKDGKPIKNNKPIGETPPDGFLMKESPGGYNYNKPVSSKSAPISSNYQTAACDGRSLEIVKGSTDLNVDSTTPAPLDLPNPIDHPLIITEEGEIVQGTGILELNMEPLGATDTC